VRVEAAGEAVDLVLPEGFVAPAVASAAFFPEKPGWMANAAPQVFRREGGRGKLRLAKEAAAPADFGAVSGVLVIGDKSYDIQTGGTP
jgi:hypothetical protein